MCQPARKSLQLWCRNPLQSPGTICQHIWNWQQYCVFPYQVKEWTQVLSWAKVKFQNWSLWREKIFKGQCYYTKCTSWRKQEAHTRELLKFGRESICSLRGSRSSLHIDRGSEDQLIWKLTKADYIYQFPHHGKKGVEQDNKKPTNFLYLL